VVVSSRPHATLKLRSNPFCQVDILGFTGEDQSHFFEKSLETQLDKLHKFSDHLDNHQAISHCCLSPFNAAVLVWLFKQGFHLPKRTTELYNIFVCHTTYQHIKLAGGSVGVQTEDLHCLDCFPSPYIEAIHQLSLSYEALKCNHL